MTNFHRTITFGILIFLPTALGPIGSQGKLAADESKAKQASSLETYNGMVQESIDYLRLQGQAQDGSFSGSAGVGPTALVLNGLLSVGVPETDPMVAKGLAFLEKHIREDGGIYLLESKHRNYDTCIAMVTFSKANRTGKYDKIISAAEKFVREIQWDQSEGKERSDVEFGGAGYGSKSRPDLSNTAFLIEALRELGAGEDDPAIQNALEFVSRCQNLETAYNNSSHAAKINDGGFYYTVAAGGESKAGEEANGGLRSYGSMTYAGLKSMIYAGLDDSDPRVKAAVSFLKKYYDLESNPGMGQQGLFYYYHTMAKALNAYGSESFVDADGDKHDWRSELLTKLDSLQTENGSWVNPNTRWMEGDPNLVTAYALLTLAECKPEA